MAGTLSALTTRGRSFIAAGVTAIACALILGERDLLRAGVLVLALPLLSAVVVSRTRYRLRCSRRASPPRLPAGHEVRIDLLLENASRLPTGILLVEDQVPYTLGGRPRFVVDRIEPHGGREMIYRLRAEARGRYLVGPLTVRLTDPFGLIELIRSFSATDRVVVTPPIVPLPPGRLTGSWTGGESRARALSTAGEDDVAPREYRHGDDLRRVHWRSTARHGELMVRREEQQWQSRGTVFLDTRRAAHWGDGPGSTFEQAVSAAASIGVRLGRDGLGLRFVTDEGEALGASATFESELLDMLAVARMSSGRSLRAGVSALRDPAAGGDGLIIGVFGALTAADAREVSRARRSGAATCVAVLIGAGDGAEAAAVLRAAGWRVLTVSSAAALAGAWPAADGNAGNPGAPGNGRPKSARGAAPDANVAPSGDAVTDRPVTDGPGGDRRGTEDPAPAGEGRAATDRGGTGAAPDGPERTEAP